MKNIEIKIEEPIDRFPKFKNWINALHLNVPISECETQEISKMIIDLLNADLIGDEEKISVFKRLIMKFNGYSVRKSTGLANVSNIS